jgi:hypothetical protein
MRKQTIIFLTLAAVVSLAGFAAGAGTASASTGPAHGAFSLSAARRVAQRHDQAIFSTAKVAACHWATTDQRVAFCDVSLLASIMDGTVATEQTWTDTVTRSGPCSTPVTRAPTPGHMGISRGGNNFGHSCFTGPVIAL